MFDWLLDRFKEPNELKFKNYMKYLKNAGDVELYEEALNYESTVPSLLIEHYPMLTFKEIDNMKWREVQFRLGFIGRKIDSELNRIENIIKQSTGATSGYNPVDRYQYSIVKDNR